MIAPHPEIRGVVETANRFEANIDELEALLQDAVESADQLDF
jgi:hypothetical protein